jgi:WD40 repeat protein
VWDPLDPGQELARFDGHTSWVEAATAADWPGLDHQVIVTGSDDDTVRVWDPLDPGQELARLPLFGSSHAILALNQTTLVFAISRGFLVFEFEG